jgi:hypothetical protein
MNERIRFSLRGDCVGFKARRKGGGGVYPSAKSKRVLRSTDAAIQATKNPG